MTRLAPLSFLRLLLLFALVAVGCTPSSCDRKSRFEKPFYITTNSEVAIVDGPGRYELNARCKSGQQLLGGGYHMPAWETSMEPGVTANYPPAADTWRVVFEVTDSQFSNQVDGNPLVAAAYCLTTSDYPLSLTIVSESTSPPANATEVSIDVKCPAGSVLTGGGYRTGISGPNFGTYNSNLFVSAPTIATNGIADGWQIAAHYFPQETPPESTVYALCAGQNLVAGPAVVEALDYTTLPYAWGWATSSAECPRDMFTTGGGYSLIGDLWIPRQASSVSAKGEFIGWSNDVAFGYQTTNYDFRPCDPSVNPDCAKTAAFAACIEIPDIPFVSVQILQPDEGQSFGSVAPDHTSTEPITFVAEAFDEDGNELGGSALQWTLNGYPMGTGDTVTFVVPTSPGSVIPATVRVTATGQSTSTYDQITVSVGTIL